MLRHDGGDKDVADRRAGLIGDLAAAELALQIRLGEVFEGRLKDTTRALAMLRESYALDPCVVVVDDPPTLKDPLGSNLCFVSARVDERTGWLVAMSSLDNLTKGAAGQAIQAWNVSTGRDETLGLPLSGVTP